LCRGLCALYRDYKNVTKTVIQTNMDYTAYPPRGLGGSSMISLPCFKLVSFP
jgi:hypothetical protein